MSTNGVVSAESLGPAIASFTAWLARRRVSEELRWACRNAVGRFVHWRSYQRRHGRVHSAERYFADLARSGASCDELEQARAAIGLFEEYLRAGPED
jgi:hypothetical protein